MKKLLPIVLIVILIVGCAEQYTLYKIKKKEELYGVDFTRYSEKGFLITTEMYQGAYKSVGIVRYQLFPEASYAPVDVKYYADGKFDTTYVWVENRINVQEAVDSLYTICKDMGADALVNYRFDIVTESYDHITNPVTLYGIEVSGFAIKRENK